MKQSNCIDVIREKYLDLRPSEQKVAEYIIRYTKEVSKLSISDLANKANVSQPTIIRFMKAIGYNGYREFKDNIILQVSKDNIDKTKLLYGFNLNKDDEIKDIPHKTVTTTVEILYKILNSISLDSFEKAIDMILNSNRIDIYGVENSTGVVNDLTNKLLYLGLDVRSYTDTYMQNIAVNSLTENDLAIGISYSGTSKDTVDIIKRAKKSNVNTLVITNFEEAIINKYADIVLHSSNSKNDIYGKAIFSRTSQVAIIDMIYMGVILSDYDKFSKVLDKNGQVSLCKSY